MGARLKIVFPCGVRPVRCAAMQNKPKKKKNKERNGERQIGDC